MLSRRCWIAVMLCAAPVGGAEVAVAIYDVSGRSKGAANLERILTAEKGFAVTRVTPDGIRGGAIRSAAVVIFPGGSGSKQSANLEKTGREEVRRFIRDGGGYVGICAGAYLASAEYPWSLHVINTRVLDRKHWARGSGVVKLSLSAEGRNVFGEDRDVVEVMYAQGPLLAPAIDADLPPYTPLALFESEVAEKGAPSGVMIGTTAIAAGRFGRGRVLVISPHPEKSHGPHHFIEAGVLWAMGADEDPSIR